MMNIITETLMFPYRKGLIEKPLRDAHILFLNAEDPTLLNGLASPVLIQPRIDKARPLIEAGYKIAQESVKRFDAVWVLPGKDREETQYLLACAVRSCLEGGLIIAAAPNDAGGKRLEGLFENLGLIPQAESKHKARVVYATVDNGYNHERAEAWFAQGQEQPILDGKFISRPGLHGWDKVDAGSALLARHFPPDLSGSIADFGCGWGYLSLQAAAVSKKITCLTLVDIDSRAVDIAKRNVQRQHPDLPMETMWADLTHPQMSSPRRRGSSSASARLVNSIRRPDGLVDPRLRGDDEEEGFGPFDAILLNPPFHAGTHAVPALGQAIITTAAQSLKAGGKLYLVANRHLPYEKTLGALFKQVEVLEDAGGFKAFLCRAPESSSSGSPPLADH